MNYEWICSCLQLAPGQWPPDHYTLLGLQPGETDARRIEQGAQERMERLRRYQLFHTDQVTEGMNRLAQALVCLTDPVAKQAYDTSLRAQQVKRPSRRSFRMPPPTNHPRAAVRRAHSRVFPRWLVWAWILWLSIGVVGSVAVLVNFPAIKESFAAHEGLKKDLKPKKPTAASPSASAWKRP